jgi:5-methylcytosine-specific restriction protein B
MKSLKTIEELIKQYKNHIRKYGFKDEVYKWELLKKFRGRPNLKVANFHNELKGINFSNLIYPIALTPIYNMARLKSTAYQACFEVLFDETKDLKERVEYFNTETLKVFRTIEADERLSHHHDERTISTFLTFRNPEKYALYKNSFYKKYCELLGIKQRKKNEKYIHYLELVDDFIENYIKPDTELLQLLNENLPKGVFEDKHYKLLAQDILYRTLDDKLIASEADTKVSNPNYWLYSPGANANKWEQFYKNGVVALNWGELGDLNDYETKDEIIEELKNIYDTKSIKINDATANYEFKNVMSIGDVVIVKGGVKQLLGYGVVTSDYIFDENRADFKSHRKIDWQSKGVWNVQRSLVIKTLTDITKYASGDSAYEKYHQHLMAIMSDANYYTDSPIIDLGIPKNQILFGPPGTGKTYHTINKSLSIIENKTEADLEKEERSELKIRFNDYVKSGQIVFTTFHQSMSYEDFVEGIKPLEPKNEGDNLIYKVESGIFKQICTEAQKKIKQVIISDEEETELTPELFKEYYEAYAEKLPSYAEKTSEIQLKTKSNKIIFDLFKNSKNSIIVKSGKKRTPTILPLSELIKVKFEDKSPTYLSYTIPVIEEVLKLADLKEEVVNNTNKKFVIIIDEINRGNVSSIFGELITLLEEDKRLGQEEELKVVLPYSKDKINKFGVPNNLYIIGTMNTADRSVEALDSALRRRFSFTEMPPNPQIIKDNLYLEDGKLESFNLVEVLETINKRVEILLDKDHLIGHSYFIAIKELDDLKKAFAEKIIPLLQEYFYGDYGKIALILGEGFCKAKEQPKTSKNVFANVKNYDVDGYLDKVIYEITDVLNDDFNIENAINLLLNKAE